MENIFAPLYSAIGWMLFIGILLGAFKTFLPMIKGKLGEKYVRDDFNRYFVEPYILINDITLPDNQSTTTQVDHIVISPFGIFVIETKNYKGWIFGSERQKQWTQSIYRQKNKFQNPIHQNYKHIKTLESLLEDIVPSNVFFGIVIFVGSAEFKSKIPKGVFLDRDWIKYIKSFKSEIIYPDQIQMIKQRLEIAPLEKSWKTNRIHVENLKQRKQNS